MTSKRVLSVQYAAQASETDWSTTPGTLKFLQPAAEIALEVGHNYVDRSAYQTANGNPLPSRQIDKMPDVPDMSFDIFGLESGGAGDTVAASGLEHPLASVFAALASGTAGGSGQTSGTQASASVIKGGVSSYGAAATAFLIEGVDGTVVARETYSQSGADSNIGRAITDKVGASQLGADTTVYYGSRSYLFGNSDPNRTHLFFDLEGSGFRRKLFGVMANGTIDAPGNGIARLNLTGAMCTDWEDTAEASPTYVAPDRGNEVKVHNAPCWIGSTLYQASGLKVDLGLKIERRLADGAPNGHYGFVVAEVVPKMSFRLRHGTFTGPSEVSDATFETLRADGTFDIMYQIGNTPGRAMAIRAPAADLSIKRVIGGGQVAYDVEALCCDASDVATAAGAHPLRVHLF